jgi:uncharacterized membrane protein (UPF0127 family)
MSSPFYRHYLSFCWIICIFLSACSPEPEAVIPLGPENYFSIPVGSTHLKLQVALNKREQAQGLMHRESLDPEHGMLFVFKGAKQRSFWMRNTRLPLDLAYFDSSGVLLELHRLYPHDETLVFSRSNFIQFALELEQGQMKALGIQPGDALNLEALARAITARGGDPDTFLP